MASISTWIRLVAPLNDRLPIPSPDGHYLASFTAIEPAWNGEAVDCELAVWNSGELVLARFKMGCGAILWSNASHLAVLDRRRSSATLIANSGGAFLIVARLALIPAAAPRWSRDGTKLAYVRAGREGQEIVVYDIQQTISFAVPLTPSRRLSNPKLLFWSPGSQDLYFIDSGNSAAALERVDIATGSDYTLANGPPYWVSPLAPAPQISPGGTKIYLPSPFSSVIDARNGKTLWRLPAEATPLERPWGNEDNRLLYAAGPGAAQIYAHDFNSHTDNIVLSNAPTDGFFGSDGRSYFFRIREKSRLLPADLALRPEDMRRWQRLDLATGAKESLGRLNLFSEIQTLDGHILGLRQQYINPRPELFDPNSRSFSELKQPKPTKALFRQLGAMGGLLLALALYTGTAGFVCLKHSASGPTRALYWFVLVMMLLLASGSLVELAIQGPRLAALDRVTGEAAIRAPSPLTLMEPVPIPLATLFGLSIALLPPVLWNFTLAFPETVSPLKHGRARRALAISVWFLPLGAMTGALKQIWSGRGSNIFASELLIIAASLAFVPSLAVFVHDLFHPPDRHTREQARWVAFSFGLPLSLTAASGLGAALVERRYGVAPAGVAVLLGLLRAGTLATWGIAPVALAYAQVSQRLLDLFHFVRRIFRFGLVGCAVGTVYLMLLGGLNLGISRSLESPPRSIFLIAGLLTTVVSVASRRHLKKFVRSVSDRPRTFLSPETEEFTRKISEILDHHELAQRLERFFQEAVGTEQLYLFVQDRQTQMLRLVASGPRLSVESTEISLNAPLCRYLVEEERLLEVEVSPFDPKLIPVFRSAGDWLGRLRAALVAGLLRRGELLGLMVLGYKELGEFYDDNELDFVALIADGAALAIDKANLLQELAKERAPNPKPQTPSTSKAGYR